jgi:hypothetical protein
MRKYILLFSILFTGVIHAQTAVSAKPALKTLTPSSFAYNLTEGSLVFTKTFIDNGTGLFVPTYTITQKLYNNGKPLSVQMTQQSFENYFKTTTVLYAAYNRILKYAQDRNISFTEEKGWTALLKNYNNSVIE